MDVARMVVALFVFPLALVAGAVMVDANRAAAATFVGTSLVLWLCMRGQLRR